MIVSGVLYTGNESELLDRLMDGQFTNVTSDEMVGELEGVLERPKSGLERDSIDPVVGMVQLLSEHVGHSRIHQTMGEIKPLLPKKLDPGDHKVLACSAAGGCQYITTGDRGLLDLGSFLGCRIVRPLEMIRIIDRDRAGQPR